ncbi:titin homolog isoform X2 [Planococcus citri]|uniref:titin homolog isoform X2 n=1 Tax=Planococcus citri TaxID=170843 RepID=UPI0031F94F9B
MSTNSLYPGTTNGVCVTSIIKDKIREYMMSDSSQQIVKSPAEISICEVEKDKVDSVIHETKNINKQDPVSTTDLVLPSSLAVSMHNSTEPCPHRQDIVTSVRRIGNSLDALLQESKKASRTKPIKKSSLTNQQQNADRLFISSDQIRSRKSVSLHDICEEYIQFITVNSSASADEEAISTTSGNEADMNIKNEEIELEIIPVSAASIRNSQISVITINENSPRKPVNSVIIQSVEEMHVAVENECEKSNGENESNVVVDKLTTEVVEKAAPGSDSDLVIKNAVTEVVEKTIPAGDSDILANLATTEVVKKDAPGSDSEVFAGLNGVKTPVEAVTAAGEPQPNIASVIKEQEKENKVDQKKEQPVSGDGVDVASDIDGEKPQEPPAIVSNGVSCDVNDDIEEEDIVDEDDVVDELSPSSQFTDAKEEQSPASLPSSVSEVESKEPLSVAEPLRKDSQAEAVVSNEAKSPATVEQNGSPANEIAEKMETDVEEVAEQKSPVVEEDSAAAAVAGDDDKMETEETKSDATPETVPVPSPAAELSPSPAVAVAIEKAPEPVTVPKDTSLEKKPHLAVIVRDKPCAVVAATNFGVAETVDDKMDTTDAEPVIKTNDDQSVKPPTVVDESKAEEAKPAVEIKPVESAEKDKTPETNIIKPVEDPVPETKIEKKPAEPEKEPAAKETATVASVKRKATADTAEEPEQDRDGGISSSSSHSSSSEADNTQDCKRIRFDESIFEEDERERLIREFVERSTETSDEIGKNCDKLQHEIAALSDLARAKELEWNSIMRLLKLKEEMLERILFKKRHIDCQNKPDLEINVNKMYKNFVTSSTTSTDQKSNRSETSTPTNINNHVSVVPIGSSISAASAAAAASASATSGSNLSNAATAPQDLYNSGSGKSSSAINSTLTSESLGGKSRPLHRPILPKPSMTSASQAAAAQSSSHVSHTLHAAVQQAAAAAAAQHMAQPPHSSSSQQQQQQHMQQQHQAQSNMMQSNAASMLVDQNSIIGEGRQGPILDVKSIIADFRSKNPDSLPRRGRRNLPFGARGIPDNGPGPRFMGNTSLLSMANIALGSGSHIRTSVTSTTHNDHRPNSFMMGQDNSVPTSLTRTEMQMRHPTIDSLMLSVNQAAAAAAASGNSSQPNSSTNSSGNSNSNNDYFRETLVKIAKLNEKREMSNAAALHMGGNNKGGGGSHLPPPPPYPEVTLHPVLVPQSSGSPPVQNSLLHGILTKSNAAAAAAAAQAASNQHHPSSTVGNAGSMGATSVSSIQHRPTTFSPTLARLLTAPERSRGHRTTIGSSGRNTKSTLNEILNSKKTRTEVTITPVTTSTAGPTKNGSDVVLDDDDESEVADRLVIDEGREVVAESASNVIPADQVPECQGCHKKAAQFVCAGCGNQWYCSRECQVEAWENHSEMCSG